MGNQDPRWGAQRLQFSVQRLGILPPHEHYLLKLSIVHGAPYSCLLLQPRHCTRQLPVAEPQVCLCTLGGVERLLVVEKQLSQRGIFLL